MAGMGKLLTIPGESVYLPDPRLRANLERKEVQGAMAEVLSKNARVGIVTQKFFCTCGGEVKMKLVFAKGKLRNTAECEKCHRQERKPSDFKA